MEAKALDFDECEKRKKEDDEAWDEMMEKWFIERLGEKRVKELNKESERIGKILDEQNPNWSLGYRDYNT